MWHRQGSGGAPGERGLTASSPALLRPALELAWAVAKEGTQAEPPVAAPSGLRPLLRFARRPERALAVTQRIIDADAEFRARVADVATEAGVGRAGWLFLTRPDGWEEELSLLSDAAAAGLEAEAEERAERSAVRKLRAAEERADKAESALADARRDVGRRDDDLVAERRARRAAEDRAAALKAEVGRLQARVDTLVSAASAAPVPAPARPAPSPPPVPALDPAPLAAAVAEATAAAARLQEALRAAEAALNAVASAPVAAPSPEPPAKPAPRAGARVRAQRQPAALPPAVFEDSVEAADHLVRVNGMVLLVDGYNASIRRWPDLPIVEQRRRLVDALAELSARCGVDVQVVFDGSDQAEARLPGQYRAAVRVTFSPPGVEADDVILGLVDTVPVHRPVVVASGDRRVQDEARRRGASVISSDQLLTVLGRSAQP